MVDCVLCDIVVISGVLMFDVFVFFIGLFEEELGVKCFGVVNCLYGLVDFDKYEVCINVINYVFLYDDGIDVDYVQVDLILVGVFCLGKMLICFYMVLYYGVSVVNYLFMDDDFDKLELLVCLCFYKDCLFGFIIDFQCLVQICEQCWVNSCYVMIEQCWWELVQVDKLMCCEGIFSFNIMYVLIEEIVSKIFECFGIECIMF